MGHHANRRLYYEPGMQWEGWLRGIAILVHEQPGLCRKTRQAIPAAIKKSMDAQPQIAFDLLDESGLFGGA